MTNSDVRETLVAEIRGLNEKVEAIKDEIEDKQRVKIRLKSTAGLQARIEMMKENWNVPKHKCASHFLSVVYFV